MTILFLMSAVLKILKSVLHKICEDISKGLAYNQICTQTHLQVCVHVSAGVDALFDPPQTGSMYTLHLFH